MLKKSFSFILNHKKIEVKKTSINESVLTWLRNNNLTASKEGCAEGDCGACTIITIDKDEDGKACYRSINSCITPIAELANKKIFTVEAFADEDKLHPVQKEMVNCNGSQCGYCTPGFISSQFETYYSKNVTTLNDLNKKISGNLCRCTGYRPIAEATINALKNKQKNDKWEKIIAKNTDNPKNSHYKNKNELYFKPKSLKKLFKIVKKHPKARFIAGSTEIGVEINKKFAIQKKLISLNNIDELNYVKKSNNGLHIGANTTLTNIDNYLIKKNILPMFRNMLDVFASNPIRNQATLGGNLATASPIADGAPALLALDATLICQKFEKTRSIKLKDFFVSYRKTLLQENEIIKEIFIPNRKKSHKIYSDYYKVSKRRELDISIVCSAFHFECDENDKVKHARIAYGGVAEKTLRFYDAEKFCLNKNFSSLANSKKLINILKNSCTPITDVRAQADYRKNQITALWQMFANKIDSDTLEKDTKNTKIKNFKFNSQNENFINNYIAHESAKGHVTGSARYVQDTALHRHDMLCIEPILSPIARGTLKKINTDKAKKVNDIIDILTAKDITGINNVAHAAHDEPMFAEKKISYHCQVLGIIIGKNPTACKKALQKIEINYKEKKPIINIKDAIDKKNILSPDNTIKKGNCEKIFKETENILEDDFNFGGQEQFYLESQSAWAEYKPDDTIFVSSSTQHPSEVQMIVSATTGLEKNKITVEAPRMGGGFGGKETQANLYAAIAAIASQKTKKPCQIQLDRDHDMQITGKRHPFYAKFKVAYSKNGKITAAKIQLYANGGWCLDLSRPVADRALFHLDNAYYIPNADFSACVVKTNCTSQTAFRGFGGPQGMLVIEEIIARISQKINKNPENVRSINFYSLYGKKSYTHYGVRVKNNQLHKIWRKLIIDSDFIQRKEEIKHWNKNSKHIKKGIAITPVKFGISFTLKHYNQAGALILIYQDGSIQINHGGTEMGQGLHSKLYKIPMQEFGLPAENLRFMDTRTDKVPNTSATAASTGSDLNGAAILDACSILKNRLANLIKKIQKSYGDEKVIFENQKVYIKNKKSDAIPFKDLIKKAYENRVNLMANGFYKTPLIGWDWKTKKGMPFLYYAFGSAVSEVTINGFTGECKLNRVDILHDVGDSLNPNIDRGQIEGGFIQGYGWLTSEDLKWDEKSGRLLSHSASTYAIPSFANCPKEFNVQLHNDKNQAHTIYASKAVGEPPLMLAFSVREAIRHAIQEFKKPNEIQNLKLPSPLTHEAIHNTIHP